MKQETKQSIAASVQNFRLPRYQEIPNVGLYLEQAAKYVGGYVSPLGEVSLTPSMISNYVKKKLITNPVKKQYYRDQIADMFFIALAKSVLSLDALARFIRLQQQTYPLETAYDYFCDELENLLQYICGLRETPARVGSTDSQEKELLRTALLSITYKIYLDQYLALLREKK